MSTTFPRPDAASGPGPHALLGEVAAHERGDDLARLVHTLAFAAADERRTTLADGLSEVALRAGIKPEDAVTPSGDVFRAIERGNAEPAGSSGRGLLAALLARGVALSPPMGADAEARIAEALLWLAANTSIDALCAVDAALGGKADGLWRAVAVLLRRIDSGSAPHLGRSAALLGAAALRESASSVAHQEAEALVGALRDPVVVALLRGRPVGGAGDAVLVQGELIAGPRHPAALLLLGVTGILLAMHLVRLAARLALRYRRPAELRVSARDVILRYKTQIIGRTLRERETVIPIEALLHATREVRYPRLLVYAGLFALALGSFFGVKLFYEGALAGSPEMLGIGALLVAGGVGLDFLLENARSGLRGRCRVVLVPRKGPVLAVADVEPSAADAALGRLSRT